MKRHVYLTGDVWGRSENNIVEVNYRLCILDGEWKTFFVNTEDDKYWTGVLVYKLDVELLCQE